MDIMETITVDVMGGLWGLAVGAIAICSAIIVAIVHIAFAIVVFRDAIYLRDPRKPIFRGAYHLVFGDTHWWGVCGG